MLIDTGSQSPSELPFGWLEQRDEASGRTYWLHVATDRISYRRPRRTLPPEPTITAMHSSDPLLTASSTTPASSSNAAAHTSPRQSTTARLASSPRDRTSALPSISDLVHSTRPSLQTRVDSSSSVSSLGSVRSPPPPYEPSSSATVGSRSPPSLGSLPPLPPITGLNNLGTSTVRRAGPRSTAAPAGPSLSTDAPRPASTTITNSIATQTTPQVNASTSFSSSSPSSFANLYPLFPGTSRHTDIPHAPILSNVTSPSPQASTLLYNPAQSPIWPAPPLPPVPPELQSERTARRSREPNDGLHRSLSADIPHQSASMGHLPVRSNSEPLSSTSSLLRTGDNFTERRNSNSLSSHYRPLRRQVMQSLREAARNLSTSSPLAGNREGSAPNLMISGSPSGRSETSFMSGTTIPLESQTLTSAPASRPESSTATGYAIGQHSTSPSGSCIPLERPRRPYVVTATNPTIIHSPGTEALRTRLDPRPPQTPYHGDLLRESNQPKGMEGKQTGLTPDIEELSNFSSSPTSPRVGARTAEECEARPSRPTVGLSGRGGSRNRFEEGTFGEVESPKECHIPDISAAIRESLPNPRRPVRTDSSPFSSSPARASVQAVSEAERYASDLASQLNTSTTRSQALLNEMYKVKLQKAKEKIDRLQGKLMELGKRDFVIERQLEKERMELKDWEIAKLDSSIMRDLGKLTEAEYARLKRELDRDMTVDILKERLAAYEPLRYDYDPFDPDGRFARQAERASRRKNPQYGSYATRKDRCKEHVYDYPHHCKPSLSRSSSFGSGHGRASLDGSWMSSHPPLGHGINPLGRSYTSKLQGTSSQTTPTHRSCSTSVFDDDDEDDTFTFLADIDDSVSEGYTSADERMFLTPRLSPFLSRRRSTSSLAALRPILRRHNPSGGRRSGMRGRRVSFEDELDVGDVGIDMFRTEPGFMSPTYR